MTKNEYLKQLSTALKPMKRTERNRSLAYFSEVIDDRMEDGSSEEQVVAGMEPVSDAAARILAEANEQGTLKQRRSVWMIILIILGSPVWLPLGAAVAVVVLTLYLTVWILIGVVFVISVSFALSGIAGLVTMGMFISVAPIPAITTAGVGLMLAGIGIVLFFPALYLAKGFAKATVSAVSAARERV